MKKIVLQVSILLNIIFIITAIYVVNKRGGISFINHKIGKIQGTSHSPHYYERKSLFELLPKDSSDIIFLGNSITEGCEWSELFSDPRIKNRGIGGDDTQGILDRLDAILEGKPQKIFIKVGSNDLGLGLKKDEILANFEKIILTIKGKSPKTELFIQSVLPVNEHIGLPENNTMIKELNHALEELSTKYKVTYINLYPLFIENGKLDTTYSSDGVHLKGSGYLKWKEAIKQYIY